MTHPARLHVTQYLASPGCGCITECGFDAGSGRYRCRTCRALVDGKPVPRQQPLPFTGAEAVDAASQAQKQAGGQP